MPLLRRADRDLAALTVLGLLLLGPRHTYEMHRMIVDTHKDFIAPRSMYHAVDRLARDALIEEAETTRAGRRPERTVYRLTEAGRSELEERLRRLLENPDPDSTLFVAALSFLGCLPITQAVSSLTVRADALESSAAQTKAAMDTVSTKLPRLLLLEAEFERDRMRTEAKWVRGLVRDLSAGEITWPDEASWPKELRAP